MKDRKKQITAVVMATTLVLMTVITASPALVYAQENQNTLQTQRAQKKISVRVHVKGGSGKTSVGEGETQTSLGTTHYITVTPNNNKYLFGGYFAGTDYYNTNPEPYTYTSMTLTSPIDIDSDTRGGTYSFTATEYIPIDNDKNYDYIPLYFHCSELPTKIWNLDGVYGETTNQNGTQLYVSEKELCGDKGKVTGYYQLADNADRSWLEWEVLSITNAENENEVLKGEVSFENNRLTYAPTEQEAGKTVHIKIRPVMGLVHEENTPIDFYIEVENAVPENEVPTITAGDKTLTVGDTFNPLDGVTASDTEDGDLTDEIEIVSDNVDTSTAGTYSVTYKVTDNQGASATKTITVTVKAKEDTDNPSDGQKPNDNDKTDNSSNNGNTIKTSNTDKNNGSVKTGDQANMGLYALALAMSGLLITILAVLRKKKAFKHR